MNLRTTLLSLALAMSCAAAPAPLPAPQAANDAEALFKKMEAAIAAKPLVLKFTSAVELPATPPFQMKGKLSSDEGNKAVFEAEGQSGTKKFKLKLESDGAKISIDRSETPPPPDLGPLPPPAVVDAPKSLTANLSIAMTHGGAWLAQEYFDGEYRAAADRHFKAMMGLRPAPARDMTVGEWHALKNFAMDKKDKIGGRAAQAIRYEMMRQNEELGLYTVVTLWIDTENSLPLKREGKIFTSTPKTHVSTWIETYEK